MNSVPSPINTQIPYTESNFEIGFLSSIFHTFILIFFAELGDKTFIMLFILQLRTNKVTIFYSALLAEILMNSLACFFGFLINYLLYKNLIDYLGILFFMIYGIFLILWGFKKTNDETFETEFEMVDEIMKQKSKRTSSMILGVDESDIQNTEENNEDKDKYNLTNVNVVNEKKYVPDIKKELTIIPEDDISREDSIIDNTTMLLSAKKQKNNNDDNDNEFILGNKNSGGIFNLKLRKTKPQTSEKKSSIDNTNNTNNTNNNIITSEFKNNDEKNEKITSEENNEENNGENTDEKLNEKKIKYKSRYYLDYVDKDIDTDKPNIDTSVFSTIFFSICLSEFGDRTQLISLSSASIFHFWGSLLGSCTALFCSCLIGVYFSKPIVKKLKQKFVDFILGILFLITGIQIYIFKLNNKNTI